MPNAKIHYLFTLFRVNISLAIAFSAFAAFVIAPGPFNYSGILVTLGAFALACGSSGLNQVQEAARDSLMARTKTRPLPSGALSKKGAVFYSLLSVFAGVIFLSLSRQSLVLMMLAFLIIFLYNGMYTYLKPHTPFAIFPGALAGALPPVMGWAAAPANMLDSRIIYIALFFFLWQMPHFWLLLWRHEEDYKRAGFAALSRYFDYAQTKRIFICWISAALLAGAFLAVISKVDIFLVPPLAILGLSSVVLTIHLGLTDDLKSITGLLFKVLNAYALWVLLSLVYTAVT